jgi:hypothetical protein
MTTLKLLKKLLASEILQEYTTEGRNIYWKLAGPLDARYDEEYIFQTIQKGCRKFVLSIQVLHQSKLKTSITLWYKGIDKSHPDAIDSDDHPDFLIRQSRNLCRAESKLFEDLQTIDLSEFNNLSFQKPYFHECMSLESLIMPSHCLVY